MHLHVCCEEWTHQPRPNRSLMISTIPAGRVPCVAAAILRIAWGEGSQAEGCEQMLLDDVQHAIRPRRIEQGGRKTRDKDLVRPDAGIRRAVIHNIEETPGLFVPEKWIDALAS